MFSSLSVYKSKIENWDLNLTWIQQHSPVWCVSGVCDSRLISFLWLPAGCSLILTWHLTGRYHHVPGPFQHRNTTNLNHFPYRESFISSFPVQRFWVDLFHREPLSLASMVTIDTMWGQEYGQRRYMTSSSNSSSFVFAFFYGGRLK